MSKLTFVATLAKVENAIRIDGDDGSGTLLLDIPAEWLPAVLPITTMKDQSLAITIEILDANSDTAISTTFEVPLDGRTTGKYYG